MDFIVGLIQGAFLADVALIIVAAGHSRLDELQVTTAGDGKPTAKGAQADSLQEQCRVLAATGMTDVIVAVTQVGYSVPKRGVHPALCFDLTLFLKEKIKANKQ